MNENIETLKAAHEMYPQKYAPDTGTERDASHLTRSKSPEPNDGRRVIEDSVPIPVRRTRVPLLQDAVQV